MIEIIEFNESRDLPALAPLFESYSEVVHQTRLNIEYMGFYPNGERTLIPESHLILKEELSQGSRILLAVRGYEILGFAMFKESDKAVVLSAIYCLDQCKEEVIAALLKTISNKDVYFKKSGVQPYLKFFKNVVLLADIEDDEVMISEARGGLL